MMTEEMRAVLVAGGITPDGSLTNQLTAAIKALASAATAAQSTTGSFNGTFTGLTAVVTVPVKYYTYGKFVSLVFPDSAQGQSNSPSFTMTGLPAALQPPVVNENPKIISMPYSSLINGTGGPFMESPECYIQGGTIFFGGSVVWTSAGAKGFENYAEIVYSVL
jgi:hypothetical protein